MTYNIVKALKTAHINILLKKSNKFKSIVSVRKRIYLNIHDAYKEGLKIMRGEKENIFSKKNLKTLKKCFYPFYILIGETSGNHSCASHLPT